MAAKDAAPRSGVHKGVRMSDLSDDEILARARAIKKHRNYERRRERHRVYRQLPEVKEREKLRTIARQLAREAGVTVDDALIMMGAKP